MTLVKLPLFNNRCVYVNPEMVTAIGDRLNNEQCELYLQGGLEFVIALPVEAVVEALKCEMEVKP